MFIRYVFIASLLGIFGCASTAYANSCANVNIMGTFDRSGLFEGPFGIYAAGTFRVAEEMDESKQPDFNIATVNCENRRYNTMGTVSLECKVTEAVVYAVSGKPDVDNPNCTLDLTFSTYSMKELQNGVLTGMNADFSFCYNSTLKIDRNTRRVYLSFTRTKDADDPEKISSATCGVTPRTEVLMNCTGWPRVRKLKEGQELPPRYCDFSSVGDK